MNPLELRAPRAEVAPDPRSANDDFKDTFRTTLGLSLLLATVLHLVAFRTWPTMQVDVWAGTADAPEIIQLPPEVEIPAAPARMARPAAPVISTSVSVDETLPVIGWEEVAELPPPPPEPVATVREDPAIPFTPYTVAPRLLNGRDVQRALEAAYPRSLRDAGVGGTVRLLVHIDDKGVVQQSRLGTTSGFESMDAVALDLAELMRFSPALNRDQKVAVWIVIPLIFEIR